LVRGPGTVRFPSVYAVISVQALHKRYGDKVAVEAKAFHPTRTARNHLRMLAAGSGIPAARADEVLEFVGLGDVKRKRPKGFSLGMAQRLGLAQAARSTSSVRSDGRSASRRAPSLTGRVGS
jgi:ABC-type nitrate/sulfonate/bicarbonate transport system ATPase subunit